MSLGADFVGGTVGGAAGVLVEHPFDTVKVLLQAGRYDSYLSCARGVFAKEGIRGFYRGMSARLVASSFEHAVVFASYKAAVRACGGDEDRPTFWQVCVGGCGSGVASMLCLTPFELVKCKMQADDEGVAARALKQGKAPAAMSTGAGGVGGGGACVSGVGKGAGTRTRKVPASIERAVLGVEVNAIPTFSSSSSSSSSLSANRQYSSSWDCARQVYSRKGTRGLYKGGVATLYREVPGTAAWCGTYDFLKMRMASPGESPKDLPPWKLMLAGGCAGVSFWTIMFPADVVKTRMQVDPAFDCYTFLQAVGVQFKEYGLKGLYRGWTLTALRSFPSNAVIFLCFDWCSRNLSAL